MNRTLTEKFIREVKKASLQCLAGTSDIEQTTPESDPFTTDLASDTVYCNVTSNDAITKSSAPKFIKVSETGSIGAISSSGHEL